MSYENPTPHEIRISEKLQKVGRKLQKLLVHHTGAECDFVLCVNSQAARGQQGQLLPGDAAIGSYIATMDRESSALSMIELIAKWQANKELPPIHELRDASGRSLAEILGAGPH